MTGFAEIKGKLTEPESPALATLLQQYLEQRNAGAWSQKARIGNLKVFSHLILMLEECGIVTLADFDAYLQNFQRKSATMTEALNAKSDRMKELNELRHRYSGDQRVLG